MSVEKVKKYFEGTELEGKVMEFNESSATVDEAAHALKTDADRIAKTLSFLIDGNPIVIVLSGLSRTSNKKYKDVFGKKASMIKFNEVENYTGFAPGGVCPFALNKGVKVYLDESLKKYDTVFPAAGSSNSAVAVTIPQLEKYSNYISWVDVSQ
ncbi:MAG: YbaK/EbsC family protein [Catonella sp.]|nr:YbaK/EbsC family protein [Catonella sp.]MDY6357334.1 YbaK/EbsC family protein [Catonella sp.]